MGRFWGSFLEIQVLRSYFDLQKDPDSCFYTYASKRRALNDKIYGDREC